MKEPKKPTEAELAILRVLWARGPSTVREVAEQMGREGAYTTVSQAPGYLGNPESGD